MKYFVTVQGRTLEVDLSGDIPLVDGSQVRAELAAVPDTPRHHLLLDGRSYPLLAHAGATRGAWEIQLAAARYQLDVVDERTRAIREMTGGGEAPTQRAVTAPMPGMVVRVEVEVGQAVKAGQGVLVVEAMKMENELKAPADGVVARIEVSAGQAVEKGATLLVLQ